jgi:hypothetical protein
MFSSNVIVVIQTNPFYSSVHKECNSSYSERTICSQETKKRPQHLHTKPGLPYFILSAIILVTFSQLFRISVCLCSELVQEMPVSVRNNSHAGSADPCIFKPAFELQHTDTTQNAHLQQIAYYTTFQETRTTTTSPPTDVPLPSSFARPIFICQPSTLC